jgi:hypothetical protein
MMSIGKFAVGLILSNPELSNEEILKKVQLEFPAAKTSMACIAWYKSDLRKKGKLAKRGAVQASTSEKIEALEAELEALRLKLIAETPEEEVQE